MNDQCFHFVEIMKTEVGLRTAKHQAVLILSLFTEKDRDDIVRRAVQYDKGIKVCQVE